MPQIIGLYQQHFIEEFGGEYPGRIAGIDRSPQSRDLQFDRIMAGRDGSQLVADLKSHVEQHLF